jgi:hypothetical protein
VNRTAKWIQLRGNPGLRHRELVGVPNNIVDKLNRFCRRILVLMLFTLRADKYMRHMNCSEVRLAVYIHHKARDISDTSFRSWSKGSRAAPRSRRSSTCTSRCRSAA